MKLLLSSHTTSFHRQTLPRNQPRPMQQTLCISMRASNKDPDNDSDPSISSSSSSKPAWEEAAAASDHEAGRGRGRGREDDTDIDSASSATPLSPTDDLDGSLVSLLEGLRGGIGGEVGGNAEVQDALDTVMQMSVRKAKVKEDILADLETKKERLRSIGEEARAELASNMSLSETLDRFKEVEDEVQAVRDQLIADKRELEEWEERQAVARSKGLFFQGLYSLKGKRDKSLPDGEQRVAGEDGEEGEIKASRARAILKVKGRAEEEMSNPWRSWVYLYLSAVLLLAMLQDLVDSAMPSYGLDALYGGLASLMGFTAWKERSGGDERDEKERASRNEQD